MKRIIFVQGSLDNYFLISKYSKCKRECAWRGDIFIDEATAHICAVAFLFLEGSL